MIERSTILIYSDISLGDSSNKEYKLQIAKQGSGYAVLFQYGRRGGTLMSDTKTPTPVPLADAEKIYDRLVREKISKGYVGAEASTALAPTPIDKQNLPGKTAYPVELLEEISRTTAEILTKDQLYWLQMKIDGHRRQVEKTESGDRPGYRGNPALAVFGEAGRDRSVVLQRFHRQAKGAR